MDGVRCPSRIKFSRPTPGRLGPVGMMNWSKCPAVEREPEVSGQWVIKGTRVPVQAVIENARDGFSAEEIAGEIFEGVSVERVRLVVRFSRSDACRSWFLLQQNSVPERNQSNALNLVQAS
jgi:uncharacterized protein (DUF433 family)